MNIDNSFFDVIQEFDYTINKQELRIESIFVGHFNSDIYFKPSDVNRFVASLLFELKKRFNNCHLADLEDKEFENALEITQALRNLVQY